jgi:hypothetical protein
MDAFRGGLALMAVLLFMGAGLFTPALNRLLVTGGRDFGRWQVSDWGGFLSCQACWG